jgi:hypothetical protein
MVVPGSNGFSLFTESSFSNEKGEKEVIAYTPVRPQRRVIASYRLSKGGVMAKDEERTDDLHTVAWARMADLPAEAPIGRFDYGDAVQRAETDGIEYDEPIELVDAPIQIRPPFTRAEKRRKQRPLPT